MTRTSTAEAAVSISRMDRAQELAFELMKTTPEGRGTIDAVLVQAGHG